MHLSTGPWRLAGRAIVACLVAAGPAAWSSPMPVLVQSASISTVVAWSTYLRAGPGQSYAALSELEHDTRVRVTGCAASWCHVVGASLQGYVDRDALDLPRTLAPVPAARTDCVVAGQADNRGPIPTRFCSATPTGR